MRLIVQIWMILALLLVQRNIAKAADEEGLMYIDGGSGEEPTGVDGGETPDDEDNTGGPAEMGSGTVGPTSKPGVMVAEGVKPSFDNTIRITKIGAKKAVFKPVYNDPNSVESQQVFATVCSVVSNSLEQNPVTNVAVSCDGVSITEGSLVVKTKLTFPEDTEVTSTDVQEAIQQSLSGDVMTAGSETLKVDPTSIAVEPSSSDPTDGTVQTTPITKKPQGVKPSKPVITPTASRPNKGNPDNDIFFPTTKLPMKTNKTTTMSNGLGDGNKLQVLDEKDKDQNFFEMILGNPVLLAALVGAVVLTLITIVLVTMFLIYRVKKKDEGSYSLDEPHKVKDPTAYWKDTKEFYA